MAIDMKFTQKPKETKLPTIKPLSEKRKLKNTTTFLKFSIIFLILMLSIYGAVTFYQTHDFRTPILFQNPVPLKKTAITSPVGKTQAVVAPKLKDLTNEEYICQKFGNHCKTAVAIVKAESGMRDDAVHTNTNGTIDMGCWQINSVHLKKGVKIETLMDCKKATDWVFDNLYKEQGFSPWVAYNTGSYLAKL